MNVTDFDGIYVIGKVNVCLVRESWVKPSVIDTKSDQVEVLALDCTFFDSSILLLEVVRELRACSLLDCV